MLTKLYQYLTFKITLSIQVKKGIVHKMLYFHQTRKQINRTSLLILSSPPFSCRLSTNMNDDEFISYYKQSNETVFETEVCG